MKKLYHYIHCPFCVRVRFAAGFLNIKLESHVLPYEDESTPNQLIGKKMLPIIDFDNGQIIGESLHIIKELDQDNQLSFSLLDNDKMDAEIEKLLSSLGDPIHNLCMPYWAYSQEFTNESRKYFINKKSKKRGPFNLLMQKKDLYLEELSPLLIQLEQDLNPFYKSDKFSIIDIMIASHIWGLYIFPEFQFSEKLQAYLQEIKKCCHFEYHQDFWNIRD